VPRTKLLRGQDPSPPEALESDVIESEVLDGGPNTDELFSAMTVSLVPGTVVLEAETTSAPRVTLTSSHPGDSHIPEPKIERTVDPDDRSGTIVHGRYQLLRQLGKGGMGTVYLARHTTLPKTFAVKLLNARYAKRTDIAERFLQEARAVSLIDHPNVVGVIDFGRDSDGSAFLVMEHLRGESIGSMCKREGPLPWPRVQHIMSQLCRALQAAHAVGVVHRDVKPDNVLRVERPDDPDFIKVLDFGLAKLQVSGGVRLTATGMVLGTPDYMSPEQARGLPSDHRTDVYAAGVMMYELLCKRVPFSATTFAEMRQKHLLEPPQPPSTWQPWINEEIDAIVLRALAKDPAHRFGSMAEMGAAIDSVGSGKSVVLLERPTLELGPGTLLAERTVIGSGRSRTEPIPAARSPVQAAVTSVSSAGLSSQLRVVRRRSGLALALLGAGLVVAAGAGLFATGIIGGSKEEEPTTVAEAPAPVPAPAPAPVPDRTVLQFETNVPVVVGDAAGRTPFGDEPTPAISLPRSDEPVRLVLRADGYRDLHVVVTPNRDQIFSAELEALPAEAEAPPAPVPAEPTPTRERGRTKKAAAEEAPPPPPEPAPEPESKHTFSPEIRDPFGGI
jgi:serine/threonine protein kinase